MRKPRKFSGNTDPMLFKSLNNPVLEKCAEYIKLKVRSTDTQDQFYSNKEVLVDRIILKIESYLPDTCDECESKYCNKVDDDTPPLLVCFICSQGSHNCEKMKEKHDKFRMCLEDPNPLLGLHWLCQGCRKKNDLVLTPKKSKTSEKKKKDMSPPKNPQTPVDTNPGNGGEEEEEEEEEKEDDEEEDEEDADTAETSDRSSPRRERCPVPTEICEKYKLLTCPHGLTGKRLIQGKPYTQSNVGFVLCRDLGLPTCKTRRNMNQMHLDHRDKIQLDARD
ncbi:unnamed protein product [Arctogadus glacialis]